MHSGGDRCPTHRTPRFGRGRHEPALAGQIIRHRTRGRTVTSPMRGAERGESCLELLLHHFRVCSCERVLGREIPMRPGRRLVRRIDSRHLLNQALPKACR
jgi:hypothetical protein